ncbi:MAG: transposase [Rhodothalassiaceae bacterium]
MARMARIVIPGLPHHVMQRGNRGQQVFFTAGDSLHYRTLLAEGCRAHGVECWAYCLMPDHVHLILVPSDEGGLRRALGEAHRRYTRHINRRNGWTGHLWQGRFASCVLDEAGLLEAARYVERAPVREGFCLRPEHWRWSSARAHLTGCDDPLVVAGPLRERCPQWAEYLAQGVPGTTARRLERHVRTGRPMGSEAFVRALEVRTGRRLRRRKPGPKPKNTAT